MLDNANTGITLEVRGDDCGEGIEWPSRINQTHSQLLTPHSSPENSLSYPCLCSLGVWSVSALLALVELFFFYKKINTSKETLYCTKQGCILIYNLPPGGLVCYCNFSAV